MDLRNWESLARKSWKEHNPTMYKALVASGQLAQALRDAAERTYHEIAELEAQGVSPHDAWEMTRENYLLLPPEQDEEELERRPNLFNETMNLQTKILQINNTIEIVN